MSDDPDCGEGSLDPTEPPAPSAQPQQLDSKHSPPIATDSANKPATSTAPTDSAAVTSTTSTTPSAAAGDTKQPPPSVDASAFANAAASWSAIASITAALQQQKNSTASATPITTATGGGGGGGGGGVCRLLSLPDDFHYSLMYCLAARDLCRLSATCKALRALADSDSHWVVLSQNTFAASYTDRLIRQQRVNSVHHRSLFASYTAGSGTANGSAAAAAASGGGSGGGGGASNPSPPKKPKIPILQQTPKQFFGHRTRTSKRWADATGSVQSLRGHRDGVFQVHFVGGGYDQLISGSGDGTVRLWDLNLNQSSQSAAAAGAAAGTDPLLTLQCNAGMLGMGYDSIYHTVAAGCWGGEMRVWSLNHHLIENVHTRSVRELKELLTARGVHLDRLTITDKSDLVDAVHKYQAIPLSTPVATLPHAHRATIVSVEAKQGLLCSCSHDSSIKIWAVKPNTGGSSGGGGGSGSGSANGSGSGGDEKSRGPVYEKQTFAGHTGGTDSICFVPQHHLIASGGKDATVKLWNINTSETSVPDQSFDGLHTNWVWCVVVDPVSGQTMSTAGVDGLIATIDLRAGVNSMGGRARTINLTRIPTEISGLNVHWSSNRMISASFDGVVRFFDTRTWKVYKEIKPKTRDRCSRLNTNDDRLAVAYMDSKLIRVWNFESEC